MISATFIAAIYFLVAMLLSTLSIVATVLVLTLHYCDDPGPVPPWLNNFLRITKVTPNKAADWTENNTGNELTEVDLPDEANVHRNMKKTTGVDYDRLQTAILYRMFVEMKKNNSENYQKTTSNQEWRSVARKLDKIFFFKFLILTILSNIVLITLYGLHI